MTWVYDPSRSFISFQTKPNGKVEWIRDIPKKNHAAWPATTKTFLSHIWPDQSPNPQWWADCVIQRADRNAIYTWRVTGLYWKLLVLHTTCFTIWTEGLYISKCYMQEVLTTWKAVWTDLYCLDLASPVGTTSKGLWQAFARQLVICAQI